MVDLRDYIMRDAGVLMSDFKCARSEDERHEARRGMLSLETLAAKLYGFDFADGLPWNAERMAGEGAGK